MRQENPCHVYVLIASGPEDLGRAVLGFTFALSAVSSGVPVTVILTLNAMAWLNEDIPEIRETVNGFPAIAETMELLRENGVVIRLCSSCVDNTCSRVPCRDTTAHEMPYVGLTEVAIQTANGSAQTVVF